MLVLAVALVRAETLPHSPQAPVTAASHTLRLLLGRLRSPLERRGRLAPLLDYYNHLAEAPSGHGATGSSLRPASAARITLLQLLRTTLVAVPHRPLDSTDGTVCLTTTQSMPPLTSSATSSVEERARIATMLTFTTPPIPRQLPRYQWPLVKGAACPAAHPLFRTCPHRFS